MLVKIRPEQATLGMYVQAFDGSWMSHPFWRARFVIESADDLARVRASDVDIMIDATKGPVPTSTTGAPPAPAATPLRRSLVVAPVPLPPGPVRRVVAPAAFGRADKARAVALARRSTGAVKLLFDDMLLSGQVSAPQILDVVRDIADTIEQNSAAFTSVTRLKAKDDTTYTHSVAVCALIVSLAREVGASPQQVQDLGAAGLLHDIGKLQIDDAILQKVDALDDFERSEIQRHPELGHALLSSDTGLPPVALDICLHHHERLDGSGYPFGLRGDAISQAARMVAICDVYDALTSERPYRQGLPPAEAIAQMEATTGQFDHALLFRFMRSLGVFPARKLIRLRSNRLAVVLPGKRENCQPVARAFYSTIDTCLTGYEDVVLSPSLHHDQALSAEDPASWFSRDWSDMCARIVTGKPL